MNVDDPLVWAQYAEEDYRLAVSLLRRKRKPLRAICFHTQQSAEKYLKALLLSKNLAFPKTHDLPTLNSLCEQAGILTGFSPELLTLLSEYAVRTRYPGEEPSLEEAREALEIAKAVRAFARRWLQFSYMS
ncbi:MAG: HEPN domain-containing protein [Anaerolineales bacterium]